MRRKLSALFFLVILACGGAWFWWQRSDAPPSADAGEFVLVDAAERALDGMPALVLSFSRPLDARRDHDKHIQVFEMPPRPGESNPRARRADAEDEEEEGGPRGRARAGVSSKPADTATEGGTAVPGAWVPGENPRLLYFPHVKPETRYVIRVMPGLRAKGDVALAAESRYSLRTSALSPAYYFASRGMVLPEKQNGGLPVVTVNVPEVDVQFLKVKPDQLPRFLDQVITAARKPGAKAAADSDEDEDEGQRWFDRSRTLKGATGMWDLDRLRGMADSVYLGRFLTEQKSNKRSVTFLPVENIKELKEPGIYVAVMTQPGRFRHDSQATYFYVTDLGLHLRGFEKSADAFVSSLADGKAVAGVEVSWLDPQGKILAQAKTDGDGRAAFAERPKGAKVVMAKKGQQLSLIALKEPALDLSEYEISGLPYKPVRLFAYSGRSLYRPGEGFDVSVLARDADGRSVPAQPIQAVLKRPDGKVHLTSTWQPETGWSGYYRRRLELPADAPTGFWSLELRNDPADKIPGTVFRFGVEEFLPERMKLELSAQNALLDAEKGFDIAVRGSYLYGAPAAGNRLLGVANYERSRNPLKAKLPGFEFGDADEDSAKSRVELPEGALGDEGQASLSVDLGPVAKRRSPFSVRATLSLLESGGRPVIRSLERVHWPAPVLVGVRPLFEGEYARENAPVQFEVVRADAGAALRAGAELPVRLFREDRNYYWRFDDQRGWNSGFTETEELVETASVATPAGGRGKLTLPVRYGRYRLEIYDPETRLTTRLRFYAGWSAKSDETQGIRPDRVALKLDKPAYAEGETVRLTLTPSHAGEALVAVEGDRTLWVKRISVPAGGTTLAIPLAKEWLRHDLYVTAMVLRPGSEGDRVTPARALGLAHVPLARADRKLSVSLDAPKKALPDAPLKVKLKAPEARGEKAVVTLYAVDVGILNITSFATPDPHGFFFGRLRYGADLHDVYGRLIEKMAGQKGKLKWGGDNTPKATKSLPKKVKLVDLFSGPVSLDAQGEAEISLPVPDFNGSLRLMAVVAAPGRFGAQEAEVVVAAPLVAELLTPRFLTIGDSATVALDLHNLSGAAQALQVEVLAGSGLKIGEPKRTLTLKDQQKATLRFALEAGNAFGLVPVRVRVSGGPIRIEREFALEVEAATPRQHVARRFVVAPGETLELKDGDLAGFYRQTVSAHAVISNRAPIDVRAAVQGLLTYPYGCAEQTTSTAFPHVLVDEEAARRFGLTPYTREQRAAMLDKAIGRLAAMQAPNGGFSLWGNMSEYEYWLSAYVTGFLQEAREQGFGVPEAMNKKAMDFLLKGLQEGVSGVPAKRPAGQGLWNESVWRDRHYAGAGRFAVLAYGGYVLARESRAPLGTLRQLYEAREWAHSGLSLVQLGIALKLMGDEQRGMQAIADGIRKRREGDQWWGDYGSGVRDTALAYALLVKHGIKAEGRENLIAALAGEMNRPQHYYSTQEKLALFLVGRSLEVADGDTAWTSEWTGGGKPEAIETRGSLFREIAPRELAAGVKLRNTHKDKLFVELAVSGHPSRLPVPPKELITAKRDYFASDGSALGERPLKVGETVIVRVVVRTSQRIANGMVVDRIPAGLEIENLNIAQGEQMGAVQVGGRNPAEAMKDGRIQHVEFRDDRFVAAARLQGELTLFYRARVVTPGKFLVPPTYVEDMYRPDVFGGGSTLETVTVSEGKGSK